MSRIKSEWTSQERKLHNALKSKKIKHRMHPKISGSPDLILTEKRVAVFLHGCFWHGCKKCYRKPLHNASFWRDKVKNNIGRDKKNKITLKKEGWEVMTFWEHSVMKEPEKVLARLIIIICAATTLL